MRCSSVASVVGIALSLSLSAVGAAHAQGDPPPLAALEARVGHGIALGGGAGDSRVRSSPLTFSALGEIAIRDTPWTSVLIGGIYEGGDRATAGALLGLRLRPAHLEIRASLGVMAILSPVEAAGPVATVGRCLAGGLRVCFDLEAVAFVIGGDLPERKIAAQLQLVIGVGFDLQ